MISSAIGFAESAHKGQVRKGTNIPYIVHPLEAAQIVSSISNDEKLITAAILHDTLEDCEEVTMALLCERFGTEVAQLVAAESEDKSKSWDERKAETIRRLRSARQEKKIVALGDKLSNMRDIHKDYILLGDSVWNKFRIKDKAKIGWYYKGLRESLASLDYTKEYAEYSMLVEQVFTAG